jgi:hypothetical protein
MTTSQVLVARWNKSAGPCTACSVAMTGGADAGGFLVAKSTSIDTRLRIAQSVCCRYQHANDIGVP